MGDNSPYLKLVKNGNNFNITGDEIALFGIVVDKLTKNGNYAKWKWNGAVLEVESSRFGTFPIYYYCTQNIFIISPSIQKIVELGVKVSPDLEALTVFFHLGFFINDETPFKEIKCLKYNTQLLWDGSLQLNHEFPLRNWEPITKTREKVLDDYIELFSNAIKLRPPKNNFAVPLSGGRDSRHILLELLNQGNKPDYCLSSDKYPPRQSTDSIIAGQLAKKYNIPILFVQPYKPRIKGEKIKNLKTGFCTDENAWLYKVFTKINELNINEIYDGLAGGVFGAAAFQPPDLLQLYNKSLDKITENLIGPDLKLFERTIQSPLFIKNNREIAFEKIRSNLFEYKGHPNPISLFYFFSRTIREISLSATHLLDYEKSAYFPYTDNDLMEYITRVPTLIANNQFHTDAIIKAFPESEQIPFCDGVINKQGIKTILHQSSSLLLMLKDISIDYNMSIKRRLNIATYLLSTIRLGSKLLRTQTRKEKSLLPSPSKMIYVLQLEAFFENNKIES